MDEIQSFLGYRQQHCMTIIKLATRLELNFPNHKEERITVCCDRGADDHSKDSRTPIHHCIRSMGVESAQCSITNVIKKKKKKKVDSFLGSYEPYIFVNVSEAT